MIDYASRLLGVPSHQTAVAIALVVALALAAAWLVARRLRRRNNASATPAWPVHAPPPLPADADIRRRLAEEQGRMASGALDQAKRAGLIGALSAALSQPASEDDPLAGLGPADRFRAALAVADALYDMGLANESGDWYRRTLLEAERLPDVPGATHAASRLSLLCYRAGDYDEAEAWLRPVVEPVRATGDRAALARCYVTLGLVRRAEGDVHRARSALRHALALFREVMDDAGAADALAELGAAAAADGDEQGRLEYWVQAVDRYRRAGEDARADALQARVDRLALGRERR